MEQKLYTTFLESPVGWLKITADEECLLSVEFKNSKSISSKKLPQILVDTKKQLSEYFCGKRKIFQLKVQPAGTEFQKKIWELVQKVPFGKTVSYLEIAVQSGSEKNTRAVGLANGKNPIPVVIPCHRIIGSNGKLTGYAGGIEKKRWLLQHELNTSENTGLLF